MFYHVTAKENVPDILKNGFLGGWGDWGYGVYFFNNIHDAMDFAANHGWDGSLKHPVILEVQVKPGEAVQGEIDSSWEDTEQYERIFYVPLKDDSEEYWVPEKVRVVGEEGPSMSGAKSKKALKFKGKRTKPNVWDKAAALDVYRSGEKLDPGANFFVLMLNQMGFQTHFSCEGHPFGFYVMFSAPYETVLKINRVGFFNIEIPKRSEKDLWSMTINLREAVEQEKEDPERMRVDWLRYAADSWDKAFGPLDFKAAELV